MICASTGNTAASAAAYAARAGMRGAVIVPEGKIARGKLAQAVMHGARVISLRGNFDQALELVQRDRRAPAGRARQLDQPVPHRGPEDGGVRGLRRAGRGAGRARDPGRERGQRHGLVEGLRRVRPGPAAAVRVPGRGGRADRARPPGGESRDGGVRHPHRQPRPLAGGRGRARASRAASIAAVSDEEILDAQRWLASTEGVFCEPASAACVAGVLKSPPRTRRCSCAC